MENEYSKMFKGIEDRVGYPNPEKVLKLVAKNPMTIKESFPKYYMTSYQDIFYRYRPKENQMSYEMWEISDREDRMGNVMMVNADIYRIDEAIEMFRNNPDLFPNCNKELAYKYMTENKGNNAINKAMYEQ